MKTFLDIRELTGRKPEGKMVFNKKISRIPVMVHKERNGFVAYVDGDMLVVSQFTLHALTKKGNRPSYIEAAKPKTALPLYRSFVEQCEEALGRPVATGVFGAMMDVELHNDGPVTILIDSKNKA